MNDRISFGAVTVGTSSLGGRTDRGPAEEVATAKAVLGGPFALVDTSNAYAAGRSEEILGRARAELGDAATAHIMTKVDSDPETGVLDRDRVLRSFDESMARLGVDGVGILHLHDPYTITVSEALAPGGAIEGMLELRDSGAVAAIGIAAGPIPLMRSYVQTGVFDALLTHNRYTLVDRSAVPLLEEARRRGMTTFNAAPFGGGILATGARSGATYAYRPASTTLVDWVAGVERACSELGVSLRAAALHFSMRSPLVDSTVVGISSAQRLRELEELTATEIPDRLWASIDACGPAPSTDEDEDE
ncbi:aldo/keto reductase [Humibacter albus]|uniref:aldo/keto reductase n=1 Tax=Humibacter albus TaxID=427754 RepID=UPI0003B69C4F|nr:aldo/keto reductase [Humibacter albus]